MAQEGPLLASVRRLGRELAAEEDVLALPAPPLPVRFWRDEENVGLRLDVLAALGGDDPSTQEQALGSLVQRGLRVTTWTGRVVAGSADTNDLEALIAIDGEIFIEAAGAVRPALDVSVSEAWHIPSGSSAFGGDGSDVIVGIVDSGIDVTHPCFRTRSGTTRILAVWDQVRGPSGRVPPRYSYGTEWDSAQIDAALAGPGMPSSLLDLGGHGTAVAGVAAGNGQATPSGRYVGVAAGADLVVVRLDVRRGSFPSTANVVDAVKYIFDVASSLGRRAVVNISQGVQTGAHDPADRLETALADLLDQDDERIIVVSAGNMGDRGAHARATVPAGGAADLEIDVPMRVGALVLIDIWYDLADLVAVEVIDPSGSASQVIEGNQQGVGQLGQDMYEIDGILNVIHVRANQVQVKLRTASRRGNVAAGQWVLRLHGRQMVSGKPVDGWLDRGLLASPRFASHAEAECTVTSPSTADGVLAVGSYLVSPTIGSLSASSGRGPNRRGAPRLLAAPGETITTCAATLMASAFYTTHVGTSLAAAHVTGAIAVMLQADPILKRTDVLDCLVRTTRNDADTAVGPRSGWGAGKLDISAALSCTRNRGLEDREEDAWG